MQDEAFAHVMPRHPRLQSLTLTMCNQITDAGLAALPSSLESLSIIACDLIKLIGVQQLRHLTALKFEPWSNLLPEENRMLTRSALVRSCQTLCTARAAILTRSGAHCAVRVDEQPQAEEADAPKEAMVFGRRAILFQGPLRAGQHTVAMTLVSWVMSIQLYAWRAAYPRQVPIYAYV